MENIILILLKCMTPLLCPLILSFNLTQTGFYKDITKNYVTMALISQIDELFARCLPNKVHANAKRINELHIMTIKKDHNTVSLIN